MPDLYGYVVGGLVLPPGRPVDSSKRNFSLVVAFI